MCLSAFITTTPALLDYLDNTVREHGKWPNKVGLQVLKLPSPAKARTIILPLNIHSVSHCSVCPVLPDRL